MFDSVAIFGAGVNGRKVYAEMVVRGINVECFIDNNKEGVVDGITIISLEEYKKKIKSLHIVIAVAQQYRREISEQLNRNGISNYSVYSELEIPTEKERIISFSHPNDREDVILYNVFKNDKEIFYIDVGCNDPMMYSVTKLLYDTKNAHGINIDPIREMIETTRRERPRDICICAGIGENDGELFSVSISGGNACLHEARDEDEICNILSLRSICQKYIQRNQTISFLKIDVEGFEKKVLLGADFKTYRPILIVIESTLPNTCIPNYNNWEYILIQAKYHFVFEYGVNRYYIADEHSEYDDSFMSIDELKKKYYILDAILVPTV